MPRVLVYPLCPARLPLHAHFDVTQLSSDGGLCWLSETDTICIRQALARFRPRGRGRIIGTVRLPGRRLLPSIT